MLCCALSTTRHPSPAFSLILPASRFPGGRGRSMGADRACTVESKREKGGRDRVGAKETETDRVGGDSGAVRLGVGSDERRGAQTARPRPTPSGCGAAGARGRMKKNLAKFFPLTY